MKGTLRKPLSAFSLGDDLELVIPYNLACFKAPGDLQGLNRNEFRMWNGIVFLSSDAIFLTRAGWDLSSILGERIFTKMTIIAGHKRLRNLTPTEKKILRGYLEKNSKSQLLKIPDGVVRELESGKILYQALYTE